MIINQYISFIFYLWITCLAVTSVLCLHNRPETVLCSTKDAYTSEITFLALQPCSAELNGFWWFGGKIEVKFFHTLWYFLIHFDTFSYFMIRFHTLWYFFILYDTFSYFMILFHTLWYFFILYDTFYPKIHLFFPKMNLISPNQRTKDLKIVF